MLRRCGVSSTSLNEDSDSDSLLMIGRVYDSEQYKLVQTNIGHNDVVGCLCHVPERGQVGQLNPFKQYPCNPHSPSSPPSPWMDLGWFPTSNPK